MSGNDAPKPPIAAVAKALVESLKDAFQVQASTAVEIKKVEAIKAAPIEDIALLASVGMKSASFQGVAALFFPSRTFLGVINRMLGESYADVTDENADAAGELMNILYASARVKINKAGNDFLPAIPTVVKGANIGMMHGGVPMIGRITCECEFGPFFVEVSLRGC